MLLLGINFIYAQQIDIKGSVTDKKLNEPIIGASVMVKGSTNGTITDFDGKFVLSKVQAGDILVISYIGYQTKEIKLTSERQYTVFLDEDTQTLDEVVVVGFGTQRKANLTDAVATVDTKVLDSRPVNQPGTIVARCSARPESFRRKPWW